MLTGPYENNNKCHCDTRLVGRFVWNRRPCKCLHSCRVGMVRAAITSDGGGHDPNNISPSLLILPTLVAVMWRKERSLAYWGHETGLVWVWPRRNIPLSIVLLGRRWHLTEYCTLVQASVCWGTTDAIGKNQYFGVVEIGQSNLAARTRVLSRPQILLDKSSCFLDSCKTASLQCCGFIIENLVSWYQQRTGCE